MTAAQAQLWNIEAEEHLQLLRSLAAELQRAMQAIALNRLKEFEDSVACQQELSSRLNELSARPGMPQREAIPPPSDSIPAPLLLEIQAASAELQDLNCRYSCLLQHASRSAAQMVSLFRSFKGQIKEVPGDRSAMRTWSCQG